MNIHESGESMQRDHIQNFRLINIIGIDGAGKTTLALNLAGHLQKKDASIRYRYCQYFAKLLYPVKRLAKLTVMRRTDEFKDYNAYNTTKKTTSTRFPILAGIYAAIWLLDYILQSFYKISLPILSGKRLIIDRYIFDIAVNLSLTTNRKPEFAEKIIKSFFKFIPEPDRVIFIDLPEEVAFSRKDDIQDIEYLRERRERYLYLGKKFGFIIIDGTRTPEQLLQDVVEILSGDRHTANPEQRNFQESTTETSKTKKELKTILYVHANNIDVGGADYCMFKLASELDTTRFRPVVCLSEKTEVMALYEKQGIRTYVIEMERLKKNPSPVYLGRLLINFFPTVKRIRKIIRLEKVDLIHGNDLLDLYGPVAGRMEKKPVTQYVRWILESPVWLKELITGIVYHLNDRVLTVSDGVAGQMFFKNNAVLPGVLTCYDWIDMEKVGHNQQGTDIREAYRIPPGSPLVGCVGRLEFWKGQEIFIRAAAIVLGEMPDTFFMVVGGSVGGRNRESYGTMLKKLAEDLNISHRVIFTGHRSDISNVMTAFDIFVHASITPDPLPGVVMEAMYCSCPVVGADAGGVPEEVDPGKTGLLYRPGDPLEMAEKIISLLKHPDQMIKMGTAGRKRVETLFDKTRLCEKIQNIYDDMIAKKTKK